MRPRGYRIQLISGGTRAVFGLVAADECGVEFGLIWQGGGGGLHGVLGGGAVASDG